MTNKKILIVTSKLDIATDRVVEHLQKKSCPIRINTESLPYKNSLSLNLQYGSLIFIDEVREYFSNPVQSIWYRKVRSAPNPEDCDILIHQYIVNETQ